MKLRHVSCGLCLMALACGGGPSGSPDGGDAGVGCTFTVSGAATGAGACDTFVAFPSVSPEQLTIQTTGAVTPSFSAVLAPTNGLAVGTFTAADLATNTIALSTSTLFVENSSSGPAGTSVSLVVNSVNATPQSANHDVAHGTLHAVLVTGTADGGAAPTATLDVSF